MRSALPYPPIYIDMRRLPYITFVDELMITDASHDEITMS